MVFTKVEETDHPYKADVLVNAYGCFQISVELSVTPSRNYVFNYIYYVAPAEEFVTISLGEMVNGKRSRKYGAPLRV